MKTVPAEIGILVIDDEESIRITFEMFLKREGYGRIRTAPNFEEALALINEEPYDLIISDIVLEGGSGTDLLKHIRKTGLRCPVVMITGFPNLESAAEAVRHGAFDYIAKPVNKETLLKFVRQGLQHWELEQERYLLQKENEKYRRYLQVIFSSVSDAIITVDDRMNIVELNATAKTWLESGGQQEAKNLKEITGAMGKACFVDASRVVEKGETVREHQVECKKGDGTIRMVSLNAAPLEDDDQEFKGAVIVARDIHLAGGASDAIERTLFHRFIGGGPRMQEVYRLIENVGRVDTAVLINGESGTGKELAAEALHQESQRRDKGLVKVDCAAMSDELLESELFGHRKGAFTGADRDRAGRLLQADGGTLFLDEIGDISPRMQLRLLRFLQEKTFTPVGSDSSIRVDVRVIAATNVNLVQKVREDRFREDLYYRLQVVEIILPPLRERRETIPQLVHYFMYHFSDAFHKKIVSISDQALEMLCDYNWPGNVRELRHVIERACVLCENTSLLSEHFGSSLTTKSQEVEKIIVGDNSGFDEAPATKTVSPAAETDLVPEDQRILQALKASGGNKARASRILGIDRSTLYRKMKRYQL